MNKSNKCDTFNRDDERCPHCGKYHNAEKLVQRLIETNVEHNKPLLLTNKIKQNEQSISR